MIEDTEIMVLARANGLGDLPAPCLGGVRINLELLRQYGALIEGLALSDRIEPAFEYVP